MAKRTKQAKAATVPALTPPICEMIGDTFICFDQTALIVSYKHTAGHKLLTPTEATALFRFFERQDVTNFMIKLWRSQLLADGNPAMRALFETLDRIFPQYAEPAEPVAENAQYAAERCEAIGA